MHPKTCFLGIAAIWKTFWIRTEMVFNSREVLRFNTIHSLEIQGVTFTFIGSGSGGILKRRIFRETGEGWQERHRSILKMPICVKNNPKQYLLFEKPCVFPSCATKCTRRLVFLGIAAIWKTFCVRTEMVYNSREVLRFNTIHSLEIQGVTFTFIGSGSGGILKRRIFRETGEGWQERHRSILKMPICVKNNPKQYLLFEKPFVFPSCATKCTRRLVFLGIAAIWKTFWIRTEMVYNSREVLRFNTIHSLEIPLPSSVQDPAASSNGESSEKPGKAGRKDTKVS